MALNWGDSKTNFRKNANHTYLVNGFDPEFVRYVDELFNTHPDVKQYEYFIDTSIRTGIRSIEDQANMGDQTTASPGRSAHNYGMAIDFAVRPGNYANVTVTPQEYLPTPSTTSTLTTTERDNLASYRRSRANAVARRLPTTGWDALIRPLEAKGGNTIPTEARSGNIGSVVMPAPFAAVVKALANHPTLQSGVTFRMPDGRSDYVHILLRNFERKARNIQGAEQYWTDTNGRRSYTVPTVAVGDYSAVAGPPISPYIAGMESFHPHIQYELTRRRNSAETANVYMPYARLTSLVNVLGENISGAQPDSIVAYCPTLGVHGIPKEDMRTISFDDMYNPQDNRSIVGYATQETNTGTKRVAVLVEDATEDPPNIPMPGIVSISTDRNTAGPMGVRGGLFRATINIRAYSLGQLNTLMKYFLRPATRVVLEIGRTSSSEAEQRLSSNTELATSGFGGDNAYTRELFQKFDWNRSRAKIDEELKPLVTLKKGQRELIQRYIYNNFGDYELFIGYVVTFKLKYTKENVYEIELTVHSVQQFEVPTRLSGTKPINNASSVTNECQIVEIDDYFNPASTFKENSFNQLLARSIRPDNIWNQHVIQLNGRTASPGASGIEKPGYLVSWRFFVDMILNDGENGLLSVFQLQDNVDESLIDVLRSGLIGRIGSTTPTRFRGVNDSDLKSNEVSWHKNLRSTDPNTMIIFNRAAQLEANTAKENEINAIFTAQNLSEEDRTKRLAEITNRSVLDKIENVSSEVGSFDNDNGTSFLTKGVWINTNAIIDAFSGSDTITSGITRLLNAMNNATQGFWNLQLLSAEPESMGLHVIDMGLSKPINTRLLRPKEDFIINISSDPTKLVDRFKDDVGKFKKSGTNDKPEYLYLFNRKSQTTPAGDIGGELLDINIDSSLPQVVAVQAIAGVGGVAQRGALSSIDIEQLKKISLYDVFPKKGVESNTPCADNPFASSNPNKSLTPEQFNQIVLALGGFTAEGETATNREEIISSIEKAAFDAWQAKNQNKTPAEILEAKSLIAADIQSIRDLPKELYERDSPGMLDLVQKYSAYFGRAIDLIETDISKFVKVLDSNALLVDEQKPHPFNSSNLTKTIVDLTLPGIGGIQLFQAFAVDRVPNILSRGYYVVTKVAHDFSVDAGWTTKIQGRFRFSPVLQRGTTQ